VDALIEIAPKSLIAVEVKSGSTVASDFFDGLDFWRARLGDLSVQPWLIYGGDTPQPRERAQVLPWNVLTPLLNAVTES